MNQMLFKVFYQENKNINPRREKTQSLYIEANSKVDVIDQLEKNTSYNIEHIVVLKGKYLEYEQKHENFKLVEY